MLPSLGDGGNVVFSPDSIETALAMVGTGAAFLGDTDTGALLFAGRLTDAEAAAISP